MVLDRAIEDKNARNDGGTRLSVYATQPSLLTSSEHTSSVRTMKNRDTAELRLVAPPQWHARHATVSWGVSIVAFLSQGPRRTEFKYRPIYLHLNHSRFGRPGVVYVHPKDRG